MEYPDIQEVIDNLDLELLERDGAKIILDAHWFLAMVNNGGGSDNTCGFIIHLLYARKKHHFTRFSFRGIFYCKCLIYRGFIDAQEKTRTSTVSPPHEPESCFSK